MNQQTNKSAPQFYAAGFFRRSFAGLLDLLLVSPLALALAWLGGEMVGISLPSSEEWSLSYWLDLFLMKDLALISYLTLVLGIFAVYLFVFQLAFSQTIGLKISGCKILNGRGDHLSVERALLRTCATFLNVLTLGFGFFWSGVDAEKRGLHDWVAGTYVVLTKPVV